MQKKEICQHIFLREKTSVNLYSIFHIFIFWLQEDFRKHITKAKTSKQKTCIQVILRHHSRRIIKVIKVLKVIKPWRKINVIKDISNMLKMKRHLLNHNWHSSLHISTYWGWMSLRMSQFKLQKSRKTQQLWHLLSWSQGYGTNWKYMCFSIVYIRKLFFLRLYSQMFTSLAFKKDRKITFWKTEEALYPVAPDKDGGAGECHSKNSGNK